MSYQEHEFDPLANLFDLGKFQARKEELIGDLYSLEAGRATSLNFTSVLSQLELSKQIRDLESKISQIEEFSNTIDVSTPSHSQGSKPVMPSEEWLEEPIKA